MNRESVNALQQLTGKSCFGDVPLKDLQQIAEAHPYFSAAQLLLAQKFQQLRNTDGQPQLFKTALFFPNQQWLRYLLLTGTKEETTSSLAEAEINRQTSEAFLPQEEIAVEELPSTDIEPAEANEDKQTEDANLITLPAGQILDEITDVNNPDNEPEEITLDEDELQEQLEPLPTEPNQKIASLLSEHAEQFRKPVEEKTDVPVGSEPFHTVDYFASQGIKLDAKREETQFDRKVHKFTDWLRQMKRINPHPSDLGTGTEDETFVATIADSSNYTKEILTESMAEVLLKQGKNEKAIEIYQKLSLLNPDKSTYFAALLQSIK